jgi:aminoglycoside 2'-N-acetyltransferase I
MELVVATTPSLPNERLTEITRLCESAFREPFDHYWTDIGPALHFVLLDEGRVGAHACVVVRSLHTQGHELSTGYVEGVATLPKLQRRGLATAVMEQVNAHIGRHYELGALDTGRHGFYARRGWERWNGPTYIRRGDQLFRTEDEDDNLMFLRTPTTPPLDPTSAISAEWRPGDLW